MRNKVARFLGVLTEPHGEVSNRNAKGKSVGRSSIETKERLSINLPEKSANRLKRIKELSEAPTNSDVIRSALRLYEWMIEEVDKGNAVYVKDAEGNERPVTLFAMQ